jgi:hypothetical protein
MIEYRHRKSRRDETFIEKQQTQPLAKRRRCDMTVPGSYGIFFCPFSTGNNSASKKDFADCSRFMLYLCTALKLNGYKR